MAYDLKAIKEKLNNLANKNSNRGYGSKKEDENKPRLKYWKPEVGTTEIRVLPYNDGNGQPVQEVLYYDSKFLTDRRFVSPYQYGMDDPINDMFVSMSSGPRLEKNVFKMLMQFRAKPSYYMPIIVRGREDEGVMFWELSEKNLQKVYMNTFAHPDSEDDDLTDLEKGFDFTVNANDSGKVFGPQNSPVLEWSVSRRIKPSKVSKAGKEASQEIVDSIPDVKAFFKQYVKSSVKIQELLDGALAGGPTSNSKSDDAGADRSFGEKDGDSVAAKNSKKAIEDAFSDL